MSKKKTKAKPQKPGAAKPQKPGAAKPQKPTAGAPERPAPEKPAPERPNDPLKELAPGSKVKYTFTDEEMAQHSRPDHLRTVEAEVLRVIPQTGEVVIKTESRPGQPWQKGCFFSKNKKPGTWHF